MVRLVLLLPLRGALQKVNHRKSQPTEIVEKVNHRKRSRS
jgi:hypothetical protein